MEHLDDGTRALQCEALPDTENIPDLLATELDDATVAYVTAARLAFDSLRQAAGQLAGILVLTATSRRALCGHPILSVAQGLCKEAAESIRALSVSAAGRHHHRHLSRAAAYIERALAAASQPLRQEMTEDFDRVLHPLRAGYRELQWAAGALPGFEIVAFQQGCCCHPAADRLSTRPPGRKGAGFSRGGQLS